MSASLRRIGLGLRARLLRILLATTAMGTAFYLLLGLPGLFVNTFYPWDALWLLSLCGVGWWLLARDRVGETAALFALGITFPVVLATQVYGISSPVTALLLPGFIVGGLIIGSRGWLAVVGFLYGWIALAGWAELQGWWVPRQQVVDVDGWVRTVFVWWFVFTSTGGLAWIFARHLERAVELARRQTAALARTVKALTVASVEEERAAHDRAAYDRAAADPPFGTPADSLAPRPPIPGTGGLPTGREALLGRVLTAIAEELNANWVTLWLHDRTNNVLGMELVYERGIIRPVDPERDPLAIMHPDSQDVPFWDEFQRTHQPIVIYDIANDPRLVNRAALLAQGVRSLTLVPLVEDEAVIGWFAIRNTKPQQYRPEELELAQALSQQVTLAAQLARLAEQEQQATLLDERNRMAREIHDTLAQGFTGIVIQLEAAEDALASDGPDAALLHLAKARTLARESLAEARRSVMALRPLALERYDLPTALRASALALAGDTGLSVDVRLNGRLPKLPPDMEADILRIGQEAITNTVKHAEATRLRITLGERAGGVELEVRDNGQGFDTAAPIGGRTRRRRGWGLVGMQERVERHGGTLAVESSVNGTRLTAWLPLGPQLSVVSGQ